LPYTKIAKLIKTSREVVEYRVKRLIDLGIINRFSTIVSSSRLGLKTYHLLLKLGKSLAEEEEQLIDFLKNFRFTKHITKCRGSYDLVYIFSVRNNKELSEVIDEINEKFSSIISEREIMIPIKPLRYSEYTFLKKVRYLKPARSSFKKYNLDLIDKKIIDKLRNNSRISFMQLSDDLNIPAETARFRFNQLLKSGLIKDFSINLNVEKLGYMSYNVYLKIDSYNGNQDKKTIAQLYFEPYILYAQRVIGKYDMVLEVVCRNSEEFEEQLSRLKKFFKNSIRNYDIALKLDEFHKNDINWR
jgi:Lrp/AsnC family leucine-responsive transcriptional regulator